MAGSKMAEKSRELGRFGFAIKIVRGSDGNIGYDTQSVNEGVPVEITVKELRLFGDQTVGSGSAEIGVIEVRSRQIDPPQVGPR